MKRTTALDKEIGYKIKQKRIESGLTQQELGDILHITFQQIQKYEKGINRVSAVSLFKISQIFKVPISDFFDENQETNKIICESSHKSRILLQFSKMIVNLKEKKLTHLMRIIKEIIKMF